MSNWPSGKTSDNIKNILKAQLWLFVFSLLATNEWILESILKEICWSFKFTSLRKILLFPYCHYTRELRVVSSRNQDRLPSDEKSNSSISKPETMPPEVGRINRSNRGTIEHAQNLETTVDLLVFTNVKINHVNVKLALTVNIKYSTLYNS